MWLCGRGQLARGFFFALARERPFLSRSVQQIPKTRGRVARDRTNHYTTTAELLSKFCYAVPDQLYRHRKYQKAEYSGDARDHSRPQPRYQRPS